MTASDGSGVGDVLPADAWAILENDQDACLIDVRTQAEWNYVGVPDLSGINGELLCVEWVRFPGNLNNPEFVSEVVSSFSGDLPGKLLFLCRSGVRSLKAANAVSGALREKGIVGTVCLNVREGFEGDADSHGHRGTINGWKFRGLAWRQS